MEKKRARVCDLTRMYYHLVLLLPNGLSKLKLYLFGCS